MLLEVQYPSVSYQLAIAKHPRRDEIPAAIKAKPGRNHKSTLHLQQKVKYALRHKTQCANSIRKLMVDAGVKIVKQSKI